MLSLATALMDRLRFRSKFTVLSLMLALTTLVLVGRSWLFYGTQIDSAEQELAGVPLAANLAKLLDTAQQHRGMTTSVAAGKSDLQSRADALSAQIDQQLQGLSQQPKNASFPVADISKALTEQWQQTRGLPVTAKPAERFQAGSLLVDRILWAMRDTLDRSGLILDPEAGTYYLMYASYYALPEAAEALGRMRGQTSAFLADGQINDNELAQIRLHMTLVQERIMIVQETLDRSIKALPAFEAKVRPIQQDLITQANQLQEVMRTKVAVAEPGISSQAYFDVASQTIKSLYAGTEQSGQLLTSALNARINDLTQNRFFFLISALVTLLGTVFLGIGAYLGLQRSLREIVATTEAMGTGDLSRKSVVTSRDELRIISDSVNRIGAGVSELIANIRSSAERVTSEASNLARAGRSVLDVIGDQNASASSMAASMQEMTVAIAHVADNSRQAQRLTEANGEHSLQGTSAVKEASREMEQISLHAQELSQLIQDLGRSGQQISSVVQVIQDVANQTNLLALNAAIEAARAGDHGRGFAVVADEVRKLAERTTASTQEITGTVQTIQTSTGLAVGQVQTWLKSVELGLTKANMAGEAMGEITESSADVVRHVGEISNALNEQSSAASDVARRVEQIAQMSDDNTRTVEQVANTAESLKALAQQLHSGVMQFRLLR